MEIFSKSDSKFFFLIEISATRRNIKKDLFFSMLAARAIISLMVLCMDQNIK